MEKLEKASLRLKLASNASCGDTPVYPKLAYKCCTFVKTIRAFAAIMLSVEVEAIYHTCCFCQRFEDITRSKTIPLALVTHGTCSHS